MSRLYSGNDYENVGSMVWLVLACFDPPWLVLNHGVA